MKRYGNLFEKVIAIDNIECAYLAARIGKKHYDELHLKVKSNYQVFPTAIRGIDFLGYRFFHDGVRVRKSIVKAFKQKIKTSQDQEQLSRSAASYWGWFVHADAKGLINKYFSHEAKLHNPAAGNS